MRYHNPGHMQCVLAVVALFFLFQAPAFGDSAAEKGLSTGEMVYVSVYSHLYSGPKSMHLFLNAILSIQNTDSKHSIQIIQADYYDSEGNLVERYVEKPLYINPLASKSLHLKKYKKEAGVGEKFILKWRSEKPVNHPVIETVMIGVRSGQGISFRCPGKILVYRSKRSDLK